MTPVTRRVAQRTLSVVQVGKFTRLFNFVCKNAMFAPVRPDPSDTSKWIAFDKWVDLPDDEGEGIPFCDNHTG